MSAQPSLSEMLRPPRLGPSASELTARGRELLDQLEEIIVEEGFSSLTVEELAKRLRCSRSTLYDLAPSKDELVLVVVDRRLRRIGRIKQERLAEIEDPAEQLKMVIASKDLHVQVTSLRFMEDVARTPAVQRLIADHLRYGVAQLRDVIEAGITSGRFRRLDSRIVAETIDAALERIQRPGLLRETGRTFDDATVELTDLLVYGLLADTKSRGSAPKRRARK
jgi:excisionase family DNA binding protein